MPKHPLRRALTVLGEWSAHPISFLLVLVFGLAWAIFEWDRFDFAAGAAMATLFMTLLIQRSEQRDYEALHAKLDEILRALPGADASITDLDHGEIEEVVDHRKAQRR